MSENTWQATADYQVILERALILKSIRAFFDARDVLEVETPVLSHSSTTDIHLDSLQTKISGVRCFLNTSPEYAMKRLLACWNRPIYQIARVFRDDESGQFHNPEFSLLEWYRPGYDMQQLMDELAALIDVLFTGASPDVSFESISYYRAFSNSTGLNPHTASSAECYACALEHNIDIPQGLSASDSVDEWLDWLLTQCVIPAFDPHVFTFLYDYPASQCSLARIEADASGQLVAKRFELFSAGIELANGFYELTEADEQLRRFEQENRRRHELGKVAGVIDRHLIAALQHGLPACSGVALGLDRLLMVKTGSKDISAVLSFSWQNA